VGEASAAPWMSSSRIEQRGVLCRNQIYTFRGITGQ
jgi:hypothetical protein